MCVPLVTRKGGREKEREESSDGQCKKDSDGGRRCERVP